MVDKEAEYSQLLMAETTNVADKTTTTDTYIYGNGLLGKEDTSGYHVYHFNQVYCYRVAECVNPDGFTHSAFLM